MSWFRTLRIDSPAAAPRERAAAALSHDGIRVTFAPEDAGRAYALVEGPDSADPARVTQSVPGRWYDEAIIALAIEPAPSDALPLLLEALGGRGAPAGVLDAAIAGEALIVDVAGDPAAAALVLQAADVELRRWNGLRRTRLLSPLPVHLTAAIAARGLQASEIASDRILETLLGLEHVVE